MAIWDSIKTAAANMWGGIVNTATTTLVGTGGVIVDTTPETLRPILQCSEAEEKRQRAVVRIRRMHDGLQGTKLTPRLMQFLGDDANELFNLRANYLSKVNRAVAKRQVIEGFDSDATNETDKGNQIAFAESVWNGSRIKSKRAQLLLMCVRDGEAFIVIDDDTENNRPRWTPHQTYTDTSVSGDGEGVSLYYPNNDINQKPLYGVKRWSEHVRQSDGRYKPIERITVWFDDRIERYAKQGTGWALADLKKPDGTFLPATEPNVDGKGIPLGIPIVHLKTPDMKPAALEAIPPQMALNKVYVDMLAASDMEAMRLLVALGWIPTHDGTKDGVPLTIEPGSWIWTDKEGASVYEIAATDSTRFIQLIDKNVAIMADVTETPLSLIQRSNQRAAEGTLQEEKEDYYAKIRDYMDTVELAFEDALKISRRHHNAFFVSDTIPMLDEGPAFKVVWQPLNLRSDEQVITDQQAQTEMFIQAQVPTEKIWRDVYGWDDDEIKAVHDMERNQTTRKFTAANTDLIGTLTQQ